jgi:hypothetical protein
VESLGLGDSVLAERGAGTDLARLAARAPGAGVEEALAAWMLGRRAGASAPADDSPARQRRWRDALVLSNGESEGIAAVLRLRPRIEASWPTGDSAARKRMAAAPGFAGALALLRAEGSAVVAAVDADLPALRAEGIEPAPFVTGDDLVALGMAPGPAFRPMLDRAYDLQLNGRFADRAAALEEVRSWVPGR